ncbi:NUDIX hydrolase [Thalassovita taeanensis]
MMQVAALCYKGKGKDRKVLLITSRGTGRWIIPKGWPITGKSSPEAALQEAWEEAGVKAATVDKTAIGTYRYDKILDDGGFIPVEAHVFALRVEKLSDAYPEAHERRRRWLRPKEAARMVDEPELKKILKNI